VEQRAHSWIAIRAIALLEDEGTQKNLVSLLKPHAGKASVGAWIPDQTDAKRGDAGSKTDNHILKIKPYGGKQGDRFAVNKDASLERIGQHRKTAAFLRRDTSLDVNWWAAPYKGAVPKPGQHLPNRVMALGTMLKDLLLVGDQRIDALIPGEIKFCKYMELDQRTREEAAAMYFLMLSHFVADVCMPCHCDARKLSAYSSGLHQELEDHWEKIVGAGFERATLLGDNADCDQILQRARTIDNGFGLDFSGVQIPGFHKDHDAWLETMFLCRASFAVASIIAPCKTYAYGDTKARAPFETVLGSGHEKLLADVDEAVMHDAVLNTAIVWKDTWTKVCATPPRGQ